MPDDRDEVGPLPPDGTDVETLRTTREEARLVLDHQLRVLDEIDRKSTRTVRITFLVLGAVFSVATLTNISPFVNSFSAFGVVSLIVSTLTGLATYTASNPSAGPGPRYLRDATETPYEEDEWLVVLLAGYHEWILDVDELNASNARLLAVTRVTTVLGIVAISLGVALEIAHIPPLLTVL